MKYYSIKDVVEAVDMVIGDDGFRSREVKAVLKHFKSISKWARDYGHCSNWSGVQSHKIESQ